MKLYTSLIWVGLLAVACLAALVSPVMAEPQPVMTGTEMPLLFGAGYISLRNYFTPQALVQYLKTLPVLKTPVIDTVFKNQPQLGLPIVGKDEVNHVIRAMPFTQRGAGSIPIVGPSGGTDYYEPLPINPDVFIGAHESNNLKMLGESGRQSWAKAKTDILRRTIRATKEAVAAKALTGTLSWPVQLEGGAFDTYQVVFGNPLAYAPAKGWNVSDASVKHVFEQLAEMQELLQEKGFGSEVEIWAGKTAFSNVLALAIKLQSTAKLKVEISDVGVDVGGFIIKRRTEKNRNPQSGAMEPVVADTDVLMIALDGGHVMPHTALDDLDANLQPLPMFVKPIDKKNPSGVQLVGMSKPFPSPNMNAVCKAAVIV